MTVTHVGTTKKYAANWALAFGKAARGQAVNKTGAAAKPARAAKKKASKKSKRAK